MRFTFPRTQHLKSRKVIDRLFNRGAAGTLPGKKRGNPLATPPAEGAPLTVFAYPFRVLYFRHAALVAPGTFVAPPQVLFSVPKRAFKKAVDRNAVRRRVSEAYRLHKHRLPGGHSTGDRESGGPDGPGSASHVPPHLNQLGPVAQIVFLYTARTKISFDEIEKGMKLALKRVMKPALP